MRIQETDELCEDCGGLPAVICVCDRLMTLSTRRKVLVLQHPQEKKEWLNSAPLLTASLKKARLSVGLSWRNLGHALGQSSKPGGTSPGRRWAVLFPDKKATETRIVGRGGAEMDPDRLEGIIALDGTWSQAKTLRWRNAWLTRLPRISLKPDQPSIYGKLRREPSRHHVSTLESVAAALTACGEDPEVEKALRRVFRTMVQRFRDLPA